MRAESSGMRLQAAMEYLVTYSWAILIIAVALALLYSFGVFNLTFFSPRAAPGACSVYRPQGPGSTYLIAYAGDCNGELPQYVASFKNKNNYMQVPSFSNHIAGLQMSMGLWAYTASSATQGFGGISNGVDAAFYVASTPNLNCGFESSTRTPVIAVSQAPVPIGKWHYFVITYNGGTLSCYMDGALVASNGATGYITNTLASLSVGYLDGSVGQYVQFYNTSLSANDVQALFTQGIGAAPLDLQNLVGWWPLNGNLKDYSGNGYNGGFAGNPTVTGLSYVTNWQTGYTVP